MRREGFKHSAETKRKIGLAHKGKIISVGMREQISRTLKGRALSLETRAKMSETRKGRPFSEAHKQALTGMSNHEWKGDAASYVAKHTWLYRHYGKAMRCDQTDDSCKGRFEWSNISRTYIRTIEDWQQLCRSHHVRFDRKRP